MKTVTAKDIKKIYAPRAPESKKYDFGLMLVIGGSEFYSGAPALSALAGFRAGLDMVRIIAPKRAADIIASFSPILASYGLDNSHFLKEHVTLVLTRTMAAKEASQGKASVVIGGGLGRTKETQEAVVEYLAQVDIPCVIDADAIHAVAQKPEVLASKPFVITAHTREFYILTGKEVRELSQRSYRDGEARGGSFADNNFIKSKHRYYFRRQRSCARERRLSIYDGWRNRRYPSWHSGRPAGSRSSALRSSSRGSIHKRQSRRTRRKEIQR